ncbi:MAG: hypothetical protein ACPIOQ_01835, partial [Promethearchaeia archaeon]
MSTREAAAPAPLVPTEDSPAVLDMGGAMHGRGTGEGTCKARTGVARTGVARTGVARTGGVICQMS